MYVVCPQKLNCVCTSVEAIIKIYIATVAVEPHISTVVFDGEAYSNVSLSSSRSYLTVHHIDIDLDPLNTTLAPTPDYHVRFVEHGSSIPILDSQNAILRDEAFSSGAYMLTVTLQGYLTTVPQTH